MQGHLIRVQFSTPDYVITFNLYDFIYRGIHVCGSSQFFLSDNGTHIDADAEWLPTLVCTNGQVRRLNYTTAEWIRDVGQADPELEGEIWWYSKMAHYENEPVYSHYLDGTKKSGDISRLAMLAKFSELRASMNDRGFAFVLQNQKIFSNNLITGQTLNPISLRYTPNVVEFNDAPHYQWHATWSTDGRRHVSRYFLRNTTLFKDNNDFVSLNWYGDICYQKVYSTDDWGFASFGSVQELIRLIRMGHQVRIHYKGYSVKANGLRVQENLVIAQSVEEFAMKENHPSFDAPFFHKDARITYRLFHTSGKIKTYIYHVHDYTTADKDDVKGAMDWFVDTRPWKRLYRTDASGQVDFGNIRDLEEAVAVGASVRLEIEQDETAGHFFTEADNVRISYTNMEIFAQAMKHVSDEKMQNVDEYILQANPFQWSLMVGSGGVVAMNARRLSGRTLRYNLVSPRTNVTWFVKN